MTLAGVTESIGQRADLPVHTLYVVILHPFFFVFFIACILYLFCFFVDTLQHHRGPDCLGTLLWRMCSSQCSIRSILEESTPELCSSELYKHELSLPSPFCCFPLLLLLMHPLLPSSPPPLLPPLLLPSHTAILEARFVVVTAVVAADRSAIGVREATVH